MSAQPSSIRAEVLLRQTAWLRTLTRALAGDEAAEDLFQETWLRALQHPTVGSEDERGLRAWLAAIARNVATSSWRACERRGTRERTGARRELVPSVAESVERVAMQRELVDAVMALDPAERDVVVLRYFEGLPPREIAARLGASNAAVRSRLSRALEKLRARLDRHFEDRGRWAALAVARPSSETRLVPWLALTAGQWTAVAAATAAVLVGLMFALRDPRAPEPGAPLAPTPLTKASDSERGERDAPSTSSDAETTVRAAVAQSAAAVSTTVATDPETLTLLARFVDARGAPLAGVTLTGMENERLDPAQSDERGEARLVLPWPFKGRLVGGGELELVARAPALATYHWYAKLAGPGEQWLGELELVPGGGVRGRVVDELGRPMPNAHVGAVLPLASGDATEREAARTFGLNLAGLGEGSWANGRTDGDGSFQVDGVAARRVSVIARAQGRLLAISAPIDVPVGACIDIGTLVVERPSDAQRIAGSVRDEHGAPARAAIKFTGDQRFELEPFRAVTDDAGRFELTVASGREYDLAFSRSAEGNDGVVLENVAAGTLDLIVTLAGSREVDVTVRGLDGSPLSQAQVSLRTPEGYGIRTRPQRTDRGTLRLTTPDGAFVVGAFAPGWRPASQGPFDSSSAPQILVFELERAAGIRGRVVADGRPISGAEVHVHRTLEGGRAQVSDDGFHCAVDAQACSPVESDAEGRFLVPLVASSTWIVHAERAGCARTSSGPIAYVDGSDVECPDLELGPGGTIEGHVLVAPGVDARGTLVGASSGDGHVESMTVGADGAFRFEHLAPGPWQLRRCEPALFDRTTSGTFLPASPSTRVVWDVDVRSGATSTFDLDLRHRVPSHVEGSLRLEGVALDGWRASLRVGPVYERGSLDAQGDFRVETPESGELELALWAPTSTTVRTSLRQTLHVRPGANSWSLSLSTGSVTLENLPVFAGEERRPTARYVLKWSNSEGVEWRASILSSDGQPISIDGVPVGHLALVDSSTDRVLLGLDVARGALTSVTLP